MPAPRITATTTGMTGIASKFIGGYYGVQGRTVNVTDVLRSRIRDGALSFVVTNSALGGDPAVGADKILIVVYRYQGKEKRHSRCVKGTAWRFRSVWPPRRIFSHCIRNQPFSAVVVSLRHDAHVQCSPSSA